MKSGYVSAKEIKTDDLQANGTGRRKEPPDPKNPIDP